MRQPARFGSAQRAGRPAITEPAWVKWLLIALSLGFLVLFLLVPLAGVFVEAFRKGIVAYFASFRDPAALAAIKLTLLVAAIAVPINCVFGLAASWAIAKFNFAGKNVLITLIDLPFAVSPVISGLIYVLLVRSPRLAGTLAGRRTISRSSSPCRGSSWRRSL